MRFALHNTSAAELEIVTATQQGNAASDELGFTLLDGDGNVLATQSLRQVVGDGVVTLANGKTVARIPAGGTFTSAPIDLTVPAAAPDRITLQLAIAQVHYHLGQEDQVSMPGPTTRLTVTLVDVAYNGELLTITPTASFGDQDIVITGRAVEKRSGQPMPLAPLKLVLTVAGFERSFDLFTDADGNFSYTFKPLATESGVYQVSVIHPDLRERPNQGQFTISRVLVSPTTFNLNSPRNYEQTITLQVTAGPGTVVNQVHLVYDALDQPFGALPTGLTLTLPAPINLQPNQAATLPLKVSADNTAAATGSFVVTVKSQDSGALTLGKVVVNYHLSEAKPALFYTPSYVETGVARGNSVSETVALENRGLTALTGINLALVTPTGAPAPAWIALTTPAALGELAIGEKRPIGIVATPTDSVSEGIYEFRLRVTSSNHPPWTSASLSRSPSPELAAPCSMWPTFTPLLWTSRVILSWAWPEHRFGYRTRKC